MKKNLLIFASLISFVIGACDNGSSQTDADTDTGTDADVEQNDADEPPDDADQDIEDTDPDAETGDADPDGPTQCEFPDPIVAGTDETNPLATSPARCGMNAYQWLDDASLGQPMIVEDEEDFSTLILQALLVSKGISIADQVTHDVGMRVISYQTQDRGEFIEATTIVAYPTDLEPGAEPPDIVLVLHGTSGFNDDCAPSLSLEYKALAALFAAMGYIAVAPDFIGLKSLGEPTGFLHPYLVGEATAIASLDAVRAAGKLAGEQMASLCPSNRVVAFGGSQGGHAALWVDRLAPYYARELDILGIVATVPPSDLITHAEAALTELINASANTTAMMGTATDWYGYQDQLSEIFVDPYHTEIPAALLAECDPDIPDFTELSQLYQPGILEAASEGRLAEYDPWGCIIEENSLTDTSIDRINVDDDSYGILFVVGEVDELVNPAIERESFDTLCTGGMPLVYLECAGADHVEASLYAIPEIVEFAQARFRGDVIKSADMCSRGPAVVCEGTPGG